LERCATIGPFDFLCIVTVGPTIREQASKFYRREVIKDVF